MKTLKQKIIQLGLILMAGFLYMSTQAQDFDQLIRTPDGKYGLVKISDTPIKDNVFHVIITVNWVNSSLQSVDERDAFLGINSSKIKNSQAGKVVCTSFRSSDYKTFNEKLDLEYAIDEHFGSGNIQLEFSFAYFNKKTKQTIGIQKLQFAQPKTLIFNKEVKAGEVVVLDRIPPKIVITSEPDLSRGFKPVYDVNEVTIAGRVTDASPIKSFSINGKLYSLMADGRFNVPLILKEGENQIYIEASDNRDNKAHESFYMSYIPPPPPVVITDNGTAGVTDSTLASDELLVGHFYALIIGENDYQDPEINSLDKPIQDAQSLRDVLVGDYTFEDKNVNFLKNATRAEIIDVLDHYASILHDKDNLVIFYAGHGYWDETKKIGY